MVLRCRLSPWCYCRLHDTWKDEIQFLRPPRLHFQPGGPPADPGSHGATRPCPVLTRACSSPYPPRLRDFFSTHRAFSPLRQGPSGPPMDGFFPGDSAHIPPPLPSTVTAALVPFTLSHQFTPPGTFRGPGRSLATWSPPDRLGPTRSTGSPLGSGRLGSVPRSHPCSAQAIWITSRTLGSSQLGSQRPVTSHDADQATPPGPGYIPPARVHAPADNPNRPKVPS
jgi:hypothetical protein